MDIPEIIVDGEALHPGKVKMKVYYDMMELDRDRPKMTIKECYDKTADLIAAVFSDPKVTRDVVLTAVEVDEFLPLYGRCYAYVAGLVWSKLDTIPNAGGGDGGR